MGACGGKDRAGQSDSPKRKVAAQVDAAKVTGWLALAEGMPPGHDLTLQSEHDQYMKVCDQLFKDGTEAELRELEKAAAKDMTKYPTIFHIAIKNAISKKLMAGFPAMHCTVVFALYKEQNRILPKGDDEKLKSHPNGEDFIRRKHAQMSWLFDGKKDSTWSLLGCDDGCPNDSIGIMGGIVEDMKYDNVDCHTLKKGVTDNCEVLDCEKLKSEAWTLDDKLVKASQKGGAIIYALHVACQKQYPGKKHVIIYTDSDLSTDLRTCGLNFQTLLTQGHNCSVSERFGIPAAINCSAKDEATGGVIPGLARDSIVHLTLRHKLRRHLLPPLSPIIDTNCGHKGIMAEAVAPVVKMVRDYKGSFDMDWLMCVGICGAADGHKKPIGVTPIAWVASVAESNFWSPRAAQEDKAAAERRVMESWFKIFATLQTMQGWHKEQLEKEGLISAEDKAWSEWVGQLDLDAYIRLVNKIQTKLEGAKDLEMPEPTIMKGTLEEFRGLATE